MFDPILEEICRARTDKSAPSPLGRWQAYLRTEVDPKLERLAAVEAENAQLREQLAKKKPSSKEAA
jgi:hypothetical protein